MLVCRLYSKTNSHQNTPYSGFAKGPRFLNMVMTFVLTPLSHYNSIIEPRACCLLSSLKDLSIDFPSYFITSTLDVYQDTVTCDKLIFPSAIMRILRHFSIPFLILPTSPPWVPSLLVLFNGMRLSFDQRGHMWRLPVLQHLLFLPPPLLLPRLVM